MVDPEVMDDALAEHIGEDDADREAVFRLLQEPQVRALAAKLDVDLKGAEAGLSGGNSTITLSTTTIIIGLLILILIIVAT